MKKVKCAFSPRKEVARKFLKVDGSNSQFIETSDTSEYPRSKTFDNLRMLVATWNVGGKSPNKGLDLRNWLRKQQISADIYVLGFQEIVPLTAGNVIGTPDKAPAARWLSLIGQSLNEETRKYSKSSANKSKQSPRVSPVTSYSYSMSLEEDYNEELFSSTNSYSSSTTSISSSSEFENRNLPHQRYRLVASKQMVGIFLCVWVRNNLQQHIKSLKLSCVGTGIMGYLGNKGSVSISMTLHNSTFCFVCTHLASGEKDGDEIRRNSDVLEILKKTEFSSKARKVSEKIVPPKSILKHENVIWLGDLNYRLASGSDDTHELVMNKNWNSLLERDQLGIERRASHIFEGWEEGRISFAPTYKYMDNSDKYVYQASSSSKKQRTPAWCDRILWRGKGLKQMLYLRGESKFSDHRPVYSLFSVQVALASDDSMSKDSVHKSQIRKKLCSQKTI